MGLFGNRKKIESLEADNRAKDKRICELENLCKEKDSYFVSPQ